MNDYDMKMFKDSLGYDVAKQNERMLMKELKELDDAYKAIKDNRLNDYIASLPESLSLEKMTYTAPSNEELKVKAEEGFKADYENDKNNLLNEIEEIREKLLSGKDSLTAGQAKALKALDEKYKAVKESINNETIKRGLSRSSVAINSLSEAELKKAEQEGIIESGTKKEIEELDKKIADLEKEKEDSVKAFDLEYAVKVQKELDKLTAERDRKAADVIEYNNRIAKQESDYKEERVEKISDYKDKLKQDDISDEEYFKKNGFYPSMKDEYQERYAMAYSFYNSISADTAKRILNENADLEKYLGSMYYNKLRTAILMRK